MQDSSFISCNLQDRNFLSCNLKGRSLLSCNLHDRHFLSCNLQDSSFLSCIGISLCPICKKRICYRPICKVAVCYRAICKIEVCYNADCRIVTLYRAICRVAVRYCVICGVAVSYRAICKMGIYLCAICKKGVFYRAICKVGVCYRVICRVGISYRAICMIGIFWWESFFFLCGHSPPAAENVVEARLNFRRPYLRWFRNFTCGDLIGNNGIEKDPVHAPPGLVWGEGMVWLSVCGLQWSFNIIRERDRRPSFDIFVVCSTLIAGGGQWHGGKSSFRASCNRIFRVPGFIKGWVTQGESKIPSFFSDINRGIEEAKWVQNCAD